MVDGSAECLGGGGREPNTCGKDGDRGERADKGSGPGGGWEGVMASGQTVPSLGTPSVTTCDGMRVSRGLKLAACPIAGALFEREGDVDIIWLRKIC